MLCKYQKIQLAKTNDLVGSNALEAFRDDHWSHRNPSLKLPIIIKTNQLCRYSSTDYNNATHMVVCTEIRLLKF